MYTHEKIYIYIYITASCQWASSRDCLKWLHCTPHSLSSTKLALNVWAAYVLVWLAARVRRWGHNNGLIWVKWPVLALWWCAAPSQRDSLAYLACVAPWQLTGICCDWCRRDKKKVGRRWTGCLYLCEPVSGGRSWDVAEQREKYRTCAGLHRPVLGTFQTLHLQRGKWWKQVHECFLFLQLKVRNKRTHTILQPLFCGFDDVKLPRWNVIFVWGTCRASYLWFPVFGELKADIFSSDSTTISRRSWQGGLYREPQ